MNAELPGLRGAVDLSSLRAPAPTASAADGTRSPFVIDATDQTFPSVLELSNTVPVVVDLWATWCGPCTQLSPILERVVGEYAGRMVLAKVDVDANPTVAGAFQAQSIPTVVALVAGQAVPLFTGAIPEDQVRAVLSQLIALAEQQGVTGSVAGAVGDANEPAPQPPLSPLHQRAFDAIEAGDYAGAAEAYRAALAENPRDAEASAGLAQVGLLGRLKGASLDAIRSAAAAQPDNLQSQLDVADLDVSGGHVEDGFARLLDLYPRLDADGQKVVRERLLELFEVVGVTDPRVNAARARLSGLLY